MPDDWDEHVFTNRVQQCLCCCSSGFATDRATAASTRQQSILGCRSRQPNTLASAASEGSVVGRCFSRRETPQRRCPIWTRQSSGSEIEKHFLDQDAYCPVQYALRSMTMNRVGILPFLTPAPTKTSNVPASANVRNARIGSQKDRCGP